MFIRMMLTAMLLVAAVPVSAEEVRFPKDDPAFGIVFPESWEMRATERGNLLARRKDGSNLLLTVSPIRWDRISDDESATAAALIFASQMGESLGLSDLQPDGPVTQNKLENGIVLIEVGYQAKRGDGGPAILTVTLFAPVKGKYFAISVLDDPAVDKATKDEQKSILNSIKG